MGNAPSI
jgi:hypothetical protein